MDDLDELLDSALDDFQNFGLTETPAKKPSSKGSELKDNEALQAQGDPPGPSWSVGSSEGAVGLGLGLGLPGLASKGKKKVVRGKGTDGTAGSRAAVPARQTSMPRPEGVSATLEKLAQQTRETVGNIDAVGEDDMMGEQLVENLIKQFEDLGGSQDMQSIMETMMRQLLSKEVLHEPMKEIAEQYPEWLATNKSQINPEDFDRYSSQHNYILQLCEVYEDTPDDFQKIMDLMQAMQNCGQPPSDIVKELAPGLDLDGNGVPMLPDFSPLGAGGQPNCSIM